MISYVREISQTKNGRVNLDQLNIEIISQDTGIQKVDLLEGKIYLYSDDAVTPDEVVLMDQIITDHSGETSTNFDERAIKTRSSLISKLTQLAIYSPYLNTEKTIQYLTAINPEINAFITTGFSALLTERITDDANAGEFSSYLNTQVNTDGVICRDYFILNIESV